MDIRKKIIISFGLIVVLLSAMGIFHIYSMYNLSNETKNIYEHPFTVSNAAKDIQIHLANIQNHLKDIILSENGEEIGIAFEKNRIHKKIIYKKFDLITDRFLGNRTDVEKASQAFNDWYKVYEEIIIQKKQQQIPKALKIIKGKFAENTIQVNHLVQYLIDFASNKATEFYTNNFDRRERFLYIIALLLIIIIIGSIFILIYVVKNHDNTLREINEYFHLIEQNILIASTNTNGIVTDISDALCRFLECTKNEIIGKQCNFFINGNDQQKLSNHIFKIINTGSEWKGDIKRINNNGEIRWFNLTIHPIFDENFKISFYKHIVQDVTDKKALEELSITDKLTNLHNRRYFDDVIEKEINLSRRKDIFLTLAIMDVDFFKKYNDNYGHPAGDEVLINVARLLKKTLNRPNDYIFRLGGEEFGIVFSDADNNASYNFLEKIKQDIELLKIKHEYNEVSEYLTVSIGAKIYKGLDIPHKNQFYIQADQSLYEAKKQRNKVSVS
ncbi:MAG: diguanylate cyclase [Thiomargarita sp.]|nr:diguanylate cyclase [Thiomargarita sp.]